MFWKIKYINLTNLRVRSKRESGWTRQIKVVKSF
jgi:hypothetical protein